MAQAMPTIKSYSLILLLAVASDALPFGHSRDFGIVDTYMQNLHESAVKKINAHRDDGSSLSSSSSPQLADRYLQIQNPCGYVRILDLEERYRSATGVSFDCTCQAYGFSDSGETTCESKEPFCCSSNFDQGMDCTTAREKAVFSVVPFSGYWVPRPRSSRVCMTFTGDDERKDSEVCKTNEFTRDETFDGSFTCQAIFDGNLCSDCAQCSDGSEGGAYDCSNVARSSNFQVTCDGGGKGPNRTCQAQSGGKVTNTEPPTLLPSKTPTSPAPTLRPTPAPKNLTTTSTPKENAPASQPTHYAQSDGDNAEDLEPEVLKTIVGPQSVLCANGFCTLSDEDAAQQCNFYALSKYGDANFNSDGKATVENINTAEGPIDIGEGCVMECKGCYLVLSPDEATTSSGFSSRSWSIAGTSMIALLGIVGLLFASEDGLNMNC